ncbi:MAG: nucleotidyltransferase family protein [Fimbriimonadaceae bacterium]
MNDLDATIAKLQSLLPQLASAYGVSRLWIFGSRARGDQSSTSDIDILVEFSRRGFSLFDFASLNLCLEDALGMKVDLVERDALRPELQPFVLPEAVAV